MKPPLRILVHGASGRMGQSLLRLASGEPDLRVVAAVSRSGPAGDAQVPWLTPAQLASAPDFDVAIDFSLPDGFDGVLALCRSRGVALVSGTTGLSARQRQALLEASPEIASVWASNFSLGVAVIGDLVRRAAQALPTWAVQLSETHHVHKKDAPSGTALFLAAAATQPGDRPPPIESIREGEVVGDHSICFSSSGETISLRHVAHDRDVFARGALHASRLLAGRLPGAYSLEELLFGPAPGSA